MMDRIKETPILATFLSFDFVVNLIILLTELQKTKMDIKAVYDVDNVTSTLTYCRHAAEKHNKWFRVAEKFVASIGMDIDVKKPRYASQQRNREKYSATTVSEYDNSSLQYDNIQVCIAFFKRASDTW